MLEYAHFVYFYIIFGDSPCFFSIARSTAGKSGKEHISPRISPLHEFWIAGLDSSILRGRYGWAKSLVSRAILV